VRVSKYEGAGPFAEELVRRAVQVIRQHYPLNKIDGIVGVPPTCSGSLVESFSRQVAGLLGIPYVDVLQKVRQTGEQKQYTNRVQKKDNVTGAFTVSVSVEGRGLLVIDDIYDSGCTMSELGSILMKAGARAVYPFTITRTLHSDDQ
jgi:ATP-dependent DNA helicase RecQ